MEAHTPKREAIEKFVGHEEKVVGNWIIRVKDREDEPVVLLQAWRDDQVESESDKSLEIHTRQVRLQDEELDEATKTMIRRWMASL